MTDTPQLAGADLARMALENARRAAKTAPTAGPTRPRPKRTRRGDGRDPVTLASAITALGADIPLHDGLAGGNILDQWPQLCPQYADRVQPIHFDEVHGRLDLRPGSHAYAAQLKLLGGQLAKQINDKLGRAVVRSIRVLPVGRIDSPPAVTDDTPAAAAPDAPVKTRETAHPGYQAARALALEHRRGHADTNSYIAEARARQEAALLANRLPETEHRDGVWETDRLLEDRVDPAEQIRRAALARARQQKASGDVPQRLFGAA
ncbi:DciA family protein [Streptomyces griseoincarnatus]